MKPLRWFATIIDRINGCFAAFAAVIFISLMLLVIYEVVMRYFFRTPPGWVIEITETMLLYITFLGTAWLLKKGGHVSVDIVHNQLNPKSRLLLDIINSIIGIIICLVLTWYSGKTTLDCFLRDMREVKTLEIPMVILLGIMPIGFFLLSLEFFRQFFGHVVRWRTSGKKEIEEKGAS